MIDGLVHPIRNSVNEIEHRQLRDGNAMLFQFRTVEYFRDGRRIVGEWRTVGSIPNYGDVFDKKPSLMVRLISWIKGK